jgi:peptide/nickel transport system substrate-binding protein
MHGGAPGAAQQGGAITISQSSPPDFLDPALTYTLNGMEPLWLVYTPLLTYRRAEGRGGSELIPGLAEALPAISPDGRTYELRLRRGLRYSDGRPVKASDFEHTIKRVLALESGGGAFYLVIDGAEEYVSRGRPEADISGIATDDRTGRITISLDEPDPTFSHVLAMLFAGLVPGDTPFRNMTSMPPPGVGPYTVASSVPGRELVLERNARFDLPGVPGAKLDTITTRIVRSTRAQARGVVAGRFDYMQDPPPAGIKRRARSRYSDRYEEHVTASTHYMFMNAQVPPFDKARVRRAVNFGIDKPALARLFAGELEPGCSFLPPTVPGYVRRFDRSGCPWGNPARRPNVRRARRLIERAGARRARVTVWGSSDRTMARVTRAYARMLNAIGLRAKAKIVDAGLYLQTIGRRRTRAQTGSVSWFQDFPHPKNFLTQVDDPSINRAMTRLEMEPRLTGAVVRRWAALNRALVRRAHLVPYGHRKVSTFMSERMDFDRCSLFHPVYGHDYSSFCLKGALTSRG